MAFFIVNPCSAPDRKVRDIEWFEEGLLLLGSPTSVQTRLLP
jgi:hypothetical protein